MSLDANALNSPARLDAVTASGLSDPAESEYLDRLTKHVTVVLGVPVALVSVVEGDRQFFKSQCGLPEPWASRRESPLSHSFCRPVVETGQTLLISDARRDPLVRDNLGVPDIGVLAYAGIPIVDDGGFVLGSLCAIDTKPRAWSSADVAILKSLSSQITAELSLRRQTVKLAAELQQQRAASDDLRSTLRLDVHDLRTPLSALLLGMDALPILGQLNTAQVEYLELCKRNGNALLNIVNNLLDIGTLRQGGRASLNRQATPLARVLERATEQVDYLATEKDIDLQIVLPPDPGLLHADADRVVRVLVNLLANAIKFTRAGGEVVLSARGVDTPAPATLFCVRDNGIGMADAQDIFKEGVKLDATAVAGRSTGLGLAFCKGVIEAHGGRIWFESAPGVGSTFFFTLPNA